ncbi:MAG: EpsG family protein [Oscillospiraceae bacterium]|nr:EpsG family protein [Oscillospiraceae bacterium]
MAIYFVVLFGSLLLCFANAVVAQKTVAVQNSKLAFLQKNGLYILACLLIVGVSALRATDLGIDLYMYEDAFSHYASGELYGLQNNGVVGPNVFYKFELLNRLYIVLIAYFTSDFGVYVMVTSLVMLVPVLWVMKKENPDNLYLWLGLLALLGSYYAISFSIVRYGMAVVCCIVAYYLLDKPNKKGWAYAFLVFAVLFHTTAIILAAAVALFGYSYKRWVYGLIIGGSTFLFLMHKPLFQFMMYLLRDTKYNIYSDMLAGGLTFAPNNIMLFTIMTALCLYYREKLLQANKKNQILINMMIFMLVFNVFYTWLPEYGRICFSFEMFLMFLLPAVLACESRKQVRLGYSAFFLVYYTYIFYNRLGINKIVPYRAFWQ